MKNVLSATLSILQLITLLCMWGGAGAIGLTLLFFVADSVGEALFKRSVMDILQARLEQLPGVKFDPLADTFPAFLAVAFVGCLCGSWLAIWLWARQRKANY